MRLSNNIVTPERKTIWMQEQSVHCTWRIRGAIGTLTRPFRAHREPGPLPNPGKTTEGPPQDAIWIRGGRSGSYFAVYGQAGLGDSLWWVRPRAPKWPKIDIFLRRNWSRPVLLTTVQNTFDFLKLFLGGSGAPSYSSKSVRPSKRFRIWT